MLLAQIAPQPMPAPAVSDPDPMEQIESRALRHLLAWWMEARGDRPMPALREVNPIAIPKALTRIWLCDYEADSGRFRYRLAGDEINDFWGYNLSGKYVDEVIPPGQLAGVLEKCYLAVKLPAMIHCEGSLSLTEEIARRCERIILPLSDDGRAVNALIGATQRDWFRELESDPYATYSESATVTNL